MQHSDLHFVVSVNKRRLTTHAMWISVELYSEKRIYATYLPDMDELFALA